MFDIFNCIQYFDKNQNHFQKATLAEVWKEIWGSGSMSGARLESEANEQADMTMKVRFKDGK